MKTTRENIMNQNQETLSPHKTVKQNSMRPMKSLFGAKSAKPSRFSSRKIKKHSVLGNLQEKFEKKES